MLMPPPSARTIVAGVVGAPIRHSLSPVLHNAWLAAAGIDGVYVALDLAPSRLAPLSEGLRGGAVRGLNVTAPFKEAALALADEATATARRAGSANTLVFERDGRIVADSTDGVGLLAALSEQAAGFEPEGAAVVILGAGGAARAAASALVEAGAARVILANRNLARAQAVAQALQGPLAACEPADAPLELADLLINALPAEAADRTPLDRLPSRAVVMDMTYRPLLTPLLSAASARGLAIVDGLAMLIGQARPAFRAFFGEATPPIDVRAMAVGTLQ